MRDFSLTQFILWKKHKVQLICKSYGTENSIKYVLGILEQPVWTFFNVLQIPDWVNLVSTTSSLFCVTCLVVLGSYAFTWSSLDKGDSLACQITSPFNKKLGCFCKAIFFKVKLSGKPVTPHDLKELHGVELYGCTDF